MSSQDTKLNGLFVLSVTQKNVKQICENCGVKMGDYFYSTCKFFDDDISKQQYHYDDCGICRVGGRDKFFIFFSIARNVVVSIRLVCRRANPA